MRWLVEVTSLGKAEAVSVTVEAESWHKALEGARRQRGEASPLNGFSIELLEDGCRAVDPASRLRYTVTRVASDAAVAPAPAPAAPAPRRQQDARPEEQPFNVVFKREQAPTDSVPLTYREYVLLVAPGTTEGAADDLLRRYLTTVRMALVDSPPGKVVNLAVFDAPFEGRPSTRPLATLGWKDWNAEPAVSFPRSASGAGPSKTAASAAPSQKVALDKGPAASAVAPRIVAPDKAPAASAATPQMAAPANASSPSAAVPEKAAPKQKQAPVEVLQAPVEVVETPRIAEPTRAQQPAVPSPPAAETHELGATLVSASAAVPPRPRLAGNELLAELFESMHELQFARDSLDGGDLCLSIATGAIASKSGIVHLYDIGRRGFVISSMSGEAVERVRTRRHPESDSVLSRAMHSRHALVIARVGEAEMPLAPRYVELGDVQSIVMARATLHGRFLGAIELIDPLDGLPFTEAEGNALTYIAEQFAEFVASRGLALDSTTQGSPRAGK
jgi:hypothetical protein